MKLRRRWRIALILVGLAGVAVAGLAWWAAESSDAGDRELARVRAELDATDPGWRFAELVEKRNAALPPDEENASVLVAQVQRRLMEGPDRKHSSEKWWEANPSGEDVNHLPDPVEADAARALWKEFREIIQLARPLRNRPRGGTRQALPANPLAYPAPDVLAGAQVARLLQFDAYLAALDRDPAISLASLHSILHVGRAAADDGTLLGALVRNACRVRCVDGLRRVLAWTEPSAELDELYAAMREEAATPLLVEALRTERAWHDFTFDALADGRLTMAQAFGAIGTPINPRLKADAFRYRPHRSADHALVLTTMTQYLEVLKRPVHEWKAAADAVPTPPADHRHLLSSQMLSGKARIIGDVGSQQAILRAALAAVASERFRRAQGRWPDGLDDLPDLPAELRLDPHNGLPLRLRRLADGLVIYSVGPDRTDNEGRLRMPKGQRGDVDIGFRLWDPAHRAAPPPAAP